MKVDIQGDKVLLLADTQRETLSLVAASRLMGDLATALELISEAPQKKTVGPTWRRPGPGEGYAILPDGRRLRVTHTEQGWVGYIDGRAVNADHPADRKSDVQRMLHRELAKIDQ